MIIAFCFLHIICMLIFSYLPVSLYLPLIFLCAVWYNCRSSYRDIWEAASNIIALMFVYAISISVIVIGWHCDDVMIRCLITPLLMNSLYYMWWRWLYLRWVVTLPNALCLLLPGNLPPITNREEDLPSKASFLEVMMGGRCDPDYSLPYYCILYSVSPTCDAEVPDGDMPLTDCCDEDRNTYWVTDDPTWLVAPDVMMYTVAIVNVIIIDVCKPILLPCSNILTLTRYVAWWTIFMGYLKTKSCVWWYLIERGGGVLCYIVLLLTHSCWYYYWLLLPSDRVYLFCDIVVVLYQLLGRWLWYKLILTGYWRTVMAVFIAGHCYWLITAPRARCYCDMPYCWYIACYDRHLHAFALPVHRLRCG